MNRSAAALNLIFNHILMNKARGGSGSLSGRSHPLWQLSAILLASPSPAPQNLSILRLYPNI